MTNGGGAGVKMSDYAYDEGYRAGMQKMREVGQRRIEEPKADAVIAKLQSKIATQRNEIARLTQKLEAATIEKAALTKDIQWMRGEK